MSTTKVAVFVGSLRKDSYNRVLARAVEALAPKDFGFEHIALDDLPHYNQDFDADYPPVARQLKQQIEAADALLFVTPEYNRAIPGVLKNAIDIASRPWGSNSFAGKRAGIIGISIGASGTALAQANLRHVLSYLDVQTLNQPEVYIQFKDGLIEADGRIGNDGTREFLQGYVDAFVKFVQRTG